MHESILMIFLRHLLLVWSPVYEVPAIAGLLGDQMVQVCSHMPMSGDFLILNPWPLGCNGATLRLHQGSPLCPIKDNFVTYCITIRSHVLKILEVLIIYKYKSTDMQALKRCNFIFTTLSSILRLLDWPSCQYFFWEQYNWCFNPWV